MNNEITLKEKLQAVDLGLVELWRSCSAEEQKQIKSDFFIMLRYISNITSKSKDSLEKKEHFILTVQEYCNKHFFTLQKHPELIWKLFCMCNYDGKTIFYHGWIPPLKRSVNKRVQLLETFFPHRKLDELELINKKMSNDEFTELCKSFGMSDSEISKY